MTEKEYQKAGLLAVKGLLKALGGSENFYIKHAKVDKTVEPKKQTQTWKRKKKGGKNNE